ncbi:MAG TPA: hypothetical protein VGK37_01555 [Casimicrobiaceae bacterium]
MKKLALVIAAGFALSGVAVTASAQHSHGGSMGGGGGWHGGGGGGGWHGGGGGWHGGGSGWHGGGWHGGHSSVSFSFGFPYWGWYYPYAYGYPYYAYGYPYPYGYYDGYSGGYSDGAPQSYIQRDTGDAVAPPPSGQYSQPQSSQPQYSYYCTNPAGYYPQVGTCPSGWLKVVPNGGPH